MAQAKTDKKKSTDPRTISTRPRGNGELEKGETAKGKEKLSRVLGK
jgi:hypothetical protein